MITNFYPEKVSMKILYLHGLYSSPTSSKKYKFLKRHFNVICPDMETGLFSLKYNSALRWFFQGWYFYICICATFAFILMQNLTLLLPLCILYLHCVKWSAQRMFVECMKIQEQYIHDFQPDVIVGSSYGAAVLTGLIRTGKWKGDSVMLAPAYSKINQCVDLDVVCKVYNSDERGHLRMFHCFNDYVVECHYAEELYHELHDTIEFKSITLRTSNYGGHKMPDVYSDLLMAI